MGEMDKTLQEEITRFHAQICSGLAEPSRILLLYALAERPQTVTDLVNRLGMPQPTVSRHLKVLRERGMVKATRDAQNICYALSDRRIIEALDLLRAVLADQLADHGNLARNATARPSI